MGGLRRSWKDCNCGGRGKKRELVGVVETLRDGEKLGRKGREKKVGSGESVPKSSSLRRGDTMVGCMWQLGFVHKTKSSVPAGATGGQ